MSLSGSPAEEVKSRLDVVQLISEYLTVKKAGVRFVALCPFHHEKTPSFSISPENQFWHCFGCHEGGDVFDFVMRMEGMTFPEALQHLAKKAGVQLKAEDSKAAGERSRMAELNRLAARFWNEILMNQPTGEAARQYVTKRELKNETLEDWLIGYAPQSWDATVNFLRKRDYRDEELIKSGLALRSERTGKVFDRFRGRVMFPIADVHGNIVGFTGRIMPGPDGKDPKSEAKYMNTPQTLVYDKSRVVFGLDKAKRDIKKEDRAVLVEGNMDVISSHQAEVRNVVASSGTALTDQHLRLLKRFTERLVLAFDLDVAGENAARRGVELAMKEGFAVRVLCLPEGAGKDADDAIRKDPEIWRRAIAEAVPYMEWFIEKIKSRTDNSDPEAKKQAASELIKEIAKLPERIERDHWVRHAGEIFKDNDYFGDLGLSVERAAKKIEKARTSDDKKTQEPAQNKPEKTFTIRPRNRYFIVSEHILAFLVTWPELVASATGLALLGETLPEEDRHLYKQCLEAYNKQRSGDSNISSAQIKAIQASIHEIFPERFPILQLMADKEYGELTGDARSKTFDRLIGEIKELHMSRMRRELTEAMVLAEKNGDDQAIAQIQQQLNQMLPG